MTTEFPRTTYERAMTAEATFILAEASARGIAVATDGATLVMIAPLKMPRETRVWFETKLDELRTEVIDIIRRKNATGAQS
jgi:hypothetical protein